MKKPVTQRKAWTIAILAVLSPALVGSFSCKGSTEPETLANIIAQNLCGAAVDVFMDGVYRFTVEHATDETIYDLAPGSYALEARKQGGGDVVHSSTLEVTQSLNYIWVIEGPSFIIVQNQYGETLNIYMNQILVNQVPDKNGVVIPKVTFGTHDLAATRASDGFLVESLELEVENVAEYVWTIVKPPTR